MYLKVLLSLCCLFSVAVCLETYTEAAPVKTESHYDFGFSCEASFPSLGFLRDGEVRKRYEHYICGQATCKDGVIHYETCGRIDPENDCPNRYLHYNKNYPDCCTPVSCD